MHDAGKDVPAIEKRPNIVGYSWLWDAFWELSTCRSRGMDVGPIPWIAVDAYTRAQDMSEHESYLLHEVIRHMDQVFLDYQHTRTAPSRKSAGSAGKRGIGRGGRR